MSRIAKRLLATAAVALLGTVLLLQWRQWAPPPAWTADEILTLRSLHLDRLPESAPEAGNAVAGRFDAIAFGRDLFFDTRLSANGSVSCATCHQPERRFTDGLPKAIAIGTTDRHTPSIVGAAYSPWQFWDGRRDSLWSQALAPLEDASEHAMSRPAVVAVIAADDGYRAAYETLFGDLPDANNASGADIDRAFVNIGKAIGAFERTIVPTESRFDRYVAAVVDGDVARQRELFSDDEVRGLRLFIGDANCTQCHNGPLLTNHEFHNTGVLSFPGDIPDKARVAGVREVLANEFNCRSHYRDDPDRACAELDFARTGPELIGAFKTPSLRNIANTEPYMHKGQIETLRAVLQHYNEAPDAMIGHNEAEPLGLSRRELSELEAFLATLDAPVGAYPDGGSEAASENDTTSSL